VSRPAPLSLRAWLAAALLAALPATGWGAPPAGVLELVQGPVRIIGADGRARPAETGATVAEGETLVTGPAGEAQLRMADSAYLALRPDSRLTLARYQARGDADDTALLRLVRGTLRSITGWIGRYNTGRYRIVTPTATLGVRGTDHEPLVVLPEEAEAGWAAGTYDKVNEGTVILENDQGSLVLEAGQAGFVPRGRPPRRLPRPPGLYRPSPNEDRIDRRKRQLAARLMEALRKRQAQRRQGREEGGPALLLPPAARDRLRSGPARPRLKRLRERPRHKR